MAGESRELLQPGGALRRRPARQMADRFQVRCWVTAVTRRPSRRARRSPRRRCGRAAGLRPRLAQRMRREVHRHRRFQGYAKRLGGLGQVADVATGRRGTVGVEQPQHGDLQTVGRRTAPTIEATSCHHGSGTSNGGSAPSGRPVASSRTSVRCGTRPDGSREPLPEATTFVGCRAGRHSHQPSGRDN